MSLRSTAWLIAAMLLGSLSVAQVVRGQDSCQIVKDYGDGTYLVQIGDKNLLAISEEDERKFLKLKRDLLDAQKEIALKDSLLATYELARAWYDTTLSRQKEYIVELKAISDDYMKLARGYERLNRESWFTVEGGIGATGNEKTPSVMMGAGIRRFRVWGFLQESNSGVMVGLAFPLL